MINLLEYNASPNLNDYVLLQYDVDIWPMYIILFITHVIPIVYIQNNRPDSYNKP